MRMLRNLRTSTPLISQIGLAVLVAGTIGDAAYHLTGAAQRGSVPSVGLVSHLVTLLGMVLVLVGVIGSAANTLRRGRTKGGNDAARRSTAVAG